MERLYPARPDFTVFGIAADLGEVSGTVTDPVVWALGMLRDPAVKVVSADGVVEQRSPYWRTTYTGSAHIDAVSSSMHTQYQTDAHLIAGDRSSARL